MRSGPLSQFDATLFVVSTLRLLAINLKLDVAEPGIAFTDFRFNCVPALGAFPEFSFHFTDAVRLYAHLLSNSRNLSVKFRLLLIKLREPACGHDSQPGPHFVAKLCVALGLRRLPLKRVHLPRDLFKN